MEMFDTVAASERGAWLHLTNMITGQPAYADEDETAPMRIRLLGMDSAEVRKRVKRRAAALTKRRGVKLDIKRMSEEQILGILNEGEGNQIMDAVDATVGWENLTRDGKPLDYSYENAEWLYKSYPAILRQVQEFLEVEANFFETA